jgi:hypothetical protein
MPLILIQQIKYTQRIHEAANRLKEKLNVEWRTVAVAISYFVSLSNP